MARTIEEQKEWDINCYGCTQVDLQEEYDNMFGKKDAGFYAVCILSDVQVLMEQAIDDDWHKVELLEKARKYVNKAKWFATYDSKHS